MSTDTEALRAQFERRMNLRGWSEANMRRDGLDYSSTQITEAWHAFQAGYAAAKAELSALAPFDAVEMLICTTRYYTGSRTISASTWAEDLARHWASLPKGARIVIKRDLDNAFERDNTSRQNREKYHALGDDCDRVMWEKVRAAWMREEVKEGTP